MGPTRMILSVTGAFLRMSPNPEKFLGHSSLKISIQFLSRLQPQTFRHSQH